MAKKIRYDITLLFFTLIAIPAFVVLFAFSRNFFAEPSYLWAKVKLSQGLWWASTVKPSIWMAKSIEKGDSETNLLGQKVAEVLDIRYYPYFSESSPYEDKYEVYLTMKVAVDQNKKTKKALFKRSVLAVGSPIEFELPASQITGTVIAMSGVTFDETLEEKIIYLTKRLAYPWEFDAIKIGETYFDGREEVFEVLDKKQSITSTLAPDAYGNLSAGTRDQTRYLTVRARVKVRVDGGNFFFGEEKQIKAGSLFSVSTPSYVFDGFRVSRIQ